MYAIYLKALADVISKDPFQNEHDIWSKLCGFYCHIIKSENNHPLWSNNTGRLLNIAEHYSLLENKNNCIFKISDVVPNKNSINEFSMDSDQAVILYVKNSTIEVYFLVKESKEIILIEKKDDVNKLLLKFYHKINRENDNNKKLTEEEYRYINYLLGGKLSATSSGKDFFKYLNDSLQMDESKFQSFSKDHRGFSQLISVFLSAYPQYMAVINNNLIEQLNITPHMPFTQHQTNAVMIKFEGYVTSLNNMKDIEVKPTIDMMAPWLVQLSQENQWHLFNIFYVKLNEESDFIRKGSLIKCLVFLLRGFAGEVKSKSLTLLMKWVLNNKDDVKYFYLERVVSLLPYLDQNEKNNVNIILMQASDQPRVLYKLLEKIHLFTEEQQSILTLKLAEELANNSWSSVADSLKLVFPKLSKLDQQNIVVMLLEKLQTDHKSIVYSVIYALNFIFSQNNVDYQAQAVAKLIDNFYENRDVSYYKSTSLQALAHLFPVLIAEHQRVIVELLQDNLTFSRGGMFELSAVMAIAPYLPVSLRIPAMQALIIYIRESPHSFFEESAKYNAKLALAIMTIMHAMEGRSDIESVGNVLAWLDPDKQHENKYLDPRQQLDMLQRVVVNKLLSVLNFHSQEYSIKILVTKILGEFAAMLASEYQEAITQALVDQLTKHDRYDYACQALAALNTISAKLSVEQKCKVLNILIDNLNKNTAYINSIASCMININIEFTVEQQLKIVTALKPAFMNALESVRASAVKAFAILATPLTNIHIEVLDALVIQSLDLSAAVRDELTAAVKCYSQCLHLDVRMNVFDKAISFFINALKTNPTLPVAATIITIINDFLSLLPERQQNYFRYGALLKEALKQQKDSSYGSMLWQATIAIFMGKQVQFNVKQLLFEHVSSQDATHLIQSYIQP